MFSLLDTDTDRVLPQLFEMCVKGGRSSRSRTDARDYDGYRRALLASGTVEGFDDPRDQALIDGWLRSCVVDMGAVGRAKTGEQMLAVAPLTLAAYRAAGAKTRLIQGAGHSPNVEKPAETAALLLDFNEAKTPAKRGKNSKSKKDAELF